MTPSMSAASATLFAIGPTWAMVPMGEGGHAGTRPKVGLMPKRPVNAQGMRIEPPPSVPTASGPIPEATAAVGTDRSEEHTSELQSRSDLVCRLLLEKKKKHVFIYA